ncbi:MAG: alpha/beta hydrolase [Acidobacteriia bacterium]|nr:alpha/beta hydrolase [Terriglobia bacterium]
MASAAARAGEADEKSSLAPETREAVAQLARALLSARPLIDVLENPVHVAPAVSGADAGAIESLLNRIASRAGAPPFAVSAPASLTIFEKIVSAHLCANGLDRVASGISAADARSIDQITDEAVQAGFDRRFHRIEVKGIDGSLLNVYTAGHPASEPVIILSACGIPARLSERWIDILAKDRFVIIGETRGLFCPLSDADFDSLASDLSAQARDLFAVMDHFTIKTAHLMGLCGGAAVALQAAAEQPQRITSLTLCYGDFELGPNAPRTVFQQNMKAVMALAGASRNEAKSIHELFCDSMVKSARADLAHLIVYPFASSELLFRYARLNGSIMNEQSDDLVAGISHPTLVITSEDDQTAHPEGSRQVAALIPGAVLHVEPHGDHLSFYEAAPHLTGLVTDFLARVRKD